MPQKDKTSVWVEGIEPSPAPAPKAPPKKPLTGRQKMEQFKMPPIPNMLKKLGKKQSKA